MRTDLPPRPREGRFDRLQELWARLHGAVDPTPRVLAVGPAPGSVARAWPREVRVSLAPGEHVLPGPPGGYAAGLAVFRTLSGGVVGRAAPVDRAEGPAFPLPSAGEPLLARWELPGMSLPLPGADRYVLDANGLSALLPPSGPEASVAVTAGSADRQEVRLQPLQPALRVEPASGYSLPAGDEATFRVHARGSGELQLWSGQRRLGRIRVAVASGGPAPDCELRLSPSELPPLSTQPVEVTLRLVRRSGVGEIEASVHVALEPEPIMVPVRLADQQSVAEVNLSLDLAQFPRVEHGDLVFLLVMRGQAARACRLPFRRVRLRRNLPRVDLRFSRYEPRPQQILVVRRSDGAPVHLDLEVPEPLRRHLEVHRLEDGRFRLVGRQPPEACLDLELRARDATSGLEERVPVRLQALGGRQE